MHAQTDMQVTLAGQTDLAGFRAEVRSLLAHQVAPEDVVWAIDTQANDPYVDDPAAMASRPRNVARAATAIVPASFTRLCEFVALHRDADRFSLLYRLLWRLVHEPGLRNDPLDADMLRAQHMAHAVRRDIHKMKGNLRMRLVQGASGGDLQMACYEPTHHIVEVVAPWFIKRMPVTRWAILSPERSVLCNEGKLHFGPGTPVKAIPAFDAPHSAWAAAFDNIFLPQRRDAAHA